MLSLSPPVTVTSFHHTPPSIPLIVISGYWNPRRSGAGGGIASTVIFIKNYVKWSLCSSQKFVRQKVHVDMMITGIMITIRNVSAYLMRTSRSFLCAWYCGCRKPKPWAWRRAAGKVQPGTWKSPCRADSVDRVLPTSYSARSLGLREPSKSASRTYLHQSRKHIQQS